MLNEKAVSTREQFFPTLYQRHGSRRIDYVLVYKTSHILSSQANIDNLSTYLKNVVDAGGIVEISYLSSDQDIAFVKIHFHYKILETYAKATGIDLACKKPQLPDIDHRSKLKCRRTPFSDGERSAIFYRAKESIGGKKPKVITQAERILLVHNILQEIRWGSGLHELGLERLQNLKVVMDSFPLHEGPTWMRKNGPLTDRQLLAAYWGNARHCLKEQPIQLLQKYFGPELAFYFAFVIFCNQMLLIASIIAMLFFAIGIAFQWKDLFIVRAYVCSSEDYLCPPCNPHICGLKQLKSICHHYFVSHLFDNFGTFLLGIFMTFWGTIFLELWRRRRNMYLLKWNLTTVEYEIKPRVGYERGTDIWLKSPVTGILEPAMSRTRVFCRATVVILTLILMCLFVFAFVIAAITVKLLLRQVCIKYVHVKFLTEHLSLIVSILGGLVQVLFIMLVGKVREFVVPFMTNFENPRTQLQYDNSFVLNLYVIDFINTYSGIFYHAFIKGVFYTNPGDRQLYSFWSIFRLETCHNAGCNIDVIILLAFILGLKQLLLKCVKKVVFPVVKYMKNNKKTAQEESKKHRLQWEEDYALRKIDQRTILIEYSEIVIRLGLVLFFTSVFPFTPLLTLLCNHIEMRVDAYTYANDLRRPVPRKVTGIEVWYSIISFVLYFGVLVNALTTFITKEFVYMQYYKMTVFFKDIESFATYRFSVFAIDDYWDEEIKEKFNVTNTCLYHAILRDPPGTPNQYGWNKSLYVITFFTVISIVIYELLVFILTGIIAIIIPNVSDEVNEQIHHQTTLEKRMVRQNRNKVFKNPQL